VLVSRSGRASGEVLAELSGLGAEVEVAACDVADRDQVAALLAGISSLTAVVHAAGVLDDGVIPALSPERLDTVLRPKADAALVLHELTRDRDLAAFVMFSSGAGVLGNAGQGNYAAANAFLDAAALRWRAEGFPAVSLAWGYWAEVSGMTGHLDETAHRRIARGGVRPLSGPDGMALLDAALGGTEAALVPMHLDLAAVRASDAPVPLLLRGLVRQKRRTADLAAPADESWLRRLAGATEAEQDSALADLVRGNAAAVLGHGTGEALDPETAFKELGFDSLTAVELRNRLTKATGLRLPATVVFDHPKPAVLARYLRAELFPAGGAAPSPEGELRRALATLPLGRFREAGVLDALMRLAGTDVTGPAEPEHGEIDAMDAEDLVQRALRGAAQA
jgi:polyketide synthase 12